MIDKAKDELYEKLKDEGIRPTEAKKVVELIVSEGYRKERYAEWNQDDSYIGKSKIVYKCSLCDHWQSEKRRDVSEQIFYMNYCPFCGAKMNKPPRKRRDKQ